MNLVEKEQLYLKAKTAYYSGNPIMTDSQFDSLEENLKLLGSTVINVVGTTESKEKAHLSPMLSLEKLHINDMSDMPIFINAFNSWYMNRFNSIPLNERYLVELRTEPKYDGSSCNLIYKDGILTAALTRGSGTMGTDITSKMKLIVPNEISLKGDVEIRGEVNIMTQTFEQKYATKYKNARNFVAGVLGRDENFSEVKDFTFIAFELRIHNTPEIFHVNDPISKLSSIGFYTPHLTRTFLPHQIEEVVKQFYKDRYESSPFGLDGMVIKFPEKYRQFIGETSHHPKSQLAIKFPATEATTTIESINWQIGQSGRFTPVGKLKGVDLDGSFVQNVTLNNIENVITQGLWPGAVITLVKSGEIIPFCKAVIKPVFLNEEQMKPFLPVHSSHPLCNVTRSGPHLVCTNEHCPDKEISKLINALRIFDIENIGPANVMLLHQSGIKNIIDVFNPHKFNKSQLLKSGLFKEGKALDIILNAPRKVKEFSLPLIINSLNFENVGKRLSKEIAKVFEGITPDWTSMSGAAYEPFLNTSSKEYQLVLEFKSSLESWGYSFAKVEEVDKKNKIGVILTGSPKESGFKTKSDFLLAHPLLVEVEKMTDAKYLITDDLSSTSSKMSKAQKAGLAIIEYSSAKNI